MLSQTERVLRLLRARGERGVNSTEFLSPTVDGGTPIMRMAARVMELRDRGMVIATSAARNGTATYVLVSEPVEQGRAGVVNPRQPSAVPETSYAPTAGPAGSASVERGAPHVPAEPDLFAGQDFHRPRGAYDEAA